MVIKRVKIIKPTPIRIGILASHNGTDMKTLVKAIEDRKLNAIIPLVISNNNNSPILEFAREKRIKSLHISRRTHVDPDAAIEVTLIDNQVDLVILCGYMRPIGKRTLQTFRGKIINIHPSLLPNYAGLQDMNIHRAVLQARETETGVTLHFVTEKIDEGEIISQSRIIIPSELLDESRELESRAQELKAIIQAKEGPLLIEYLIQYNQ